MPSVTFIFRKEENTIPVSHIAVQWQEHLPRGWKTPLEPSAIELKFLKPTSLPYPQQPAAQAEELRAFHHVPLQKIKSQELRKLEQ